jgi:hypothetical protein
MKYQKPSKGSELPKVGTFADNELNQPSWNQQCPSLARAEDFEINAWQDAVSVHGQTGDTKAERKRLLKTGRDTNRKSYIPADEHGRHLSAE